MNYSFKYIYVIIVSNPRKMEQMVMGQLFFPFVPVERSEALF